MYLAAIFFSADQNAIVFLYRSSVAQYKEHMFTCALYVHYTRRGINSHLFEYTKWAEVPIYITLSFGHTLSCFQTELQDDEPTILSAKWYGAFVHYNIKCYVMSTCVLIGNMYITYQ